MTSAGGWAMRELAEFLAVLSASTDAQSAVDESLDCLLHSFEGDACAFLDQHNLSASRGWTEPTPSSEILAAASNEQIGIHVPGVGWCETVALPVDRDSGASLLLARARRPFTAEEVSLLRGMSRALALTLRLLETVAVERQHLEDNQALVVSLRERQILMERLADIQRSISSRDPLQQVFDAITTGAVELLGDDVVGLRLIDETDPGMMVVVSAVDISHELDASFGHAPVGTGIGGRAIVENRLCVAENYQSADGAIGAFIDNGIQAAMAAPIRLKGRSTGSLAVASRRQGRTYSQPERDILVAFAEHASLALNDARSVQAMNQALQDARYQALHDELTGLANRACFYDRADQALRQAGRDGTSTAVLLFDLDRFKEINDTLGHKYGDRVLCEIGPRVRRGLRDADTLARVGGDEFCVLLADVGPPDAALEVAHRIMALLEEPFEIDGTILFIEASCGIAIAPGDGDNADSLLQRSDVAMYVAKASHAKVMTYHNGLDVNSPARLSLLGELRKAITQGQLVLYYQPTAALNSGRIRGVEALVRWQHPTRGLLPPDEFIPLAEHTGLITPLTTWVLNTALRQLGQWRTRTDQTFPEQFSVAVNISTRSLFDDDFPTEVIAALNRAQIPAHLLELEITESTMMADPLRAHRLLTELATTGIKLAIDDFGTGYSSLTYLKHLPVHQLKIDKSFVLHMRLDPNDAIIVKSVIDLGHNLGLQSIAEGIEDLTTWHQLTELGCDNGQGYFLAKPMPANELDTWLQRRNAESRNIKSSASR